MNVERMLIADLVEDPANVRKHAEKNLRAIKGSLKRFGQQKPIVVDGRGIVIAGNGTLAAARAIGWAEIDVVRTTLVGAEAVAYAIADNRSGDLADWDDDGLAKALAALDADGWDLPDMGWDDGDWDKPTPPAAEGLTDADEMPETAPARAQRGQVWRLGAHRLMCGDSTSAEDVARLLGGAEPMLMVTDPPYGVEYDAGWRADASESSAALYDDKPEMQRRGAISNDGQSDWSAAWKAWPARIAYVWHASQFTDVVLRGLREAGYHVRQQIIWNKPFAPMSRSAYHWKHEPCWYAVREGATANWQGDRKQTTVWDFTSPLACYGQTDDADKVRTDHPTQKPVGLMQRSVEHHTVPGDVVCDPFCGSGSTLIACEKTGRRCYGMEIDPHYCSVIVERWCKFTGKMAYRLNDDGTQTPWDEIEGGQP